MATAVAGAAERIAERRAVERLLGRTSHPANLAVLRVCVGLAVLNLCWYDQAWRFSSYDESLMVKPYGGGWVVALLPRPGWLMVGLTLLVAGCAVCLVIGWRSRWAAGVAAVAGFWVFGVSQLWGKVNHHHHLLWLLVLLACSRCGDALTVERKPRSEPSTAYGVPLRLGWLLMGTVYLFPGLAKLRAGPDWWIGDHLYNTVAIQRWLIEPGYGFGIPRWLSTPGAIAVLIFEIGFVVLVLTRWRRWLLVAGVGFHLSTAMTMGIQFRSMLLLYPALWVFWPEQQEPREGRLPRAPVVAGTALLIGAWLAGATLNINGWPFASYPTFDDVHATTEVMTYELVADGEVLSPIDVWPDVGRTRARAQAEQTWGDENAMAALGTSGDFYVVRIDVTTGEEVARWLVGST